MARSRFNLHTRRNQKHSAFQTADGGATNYKMNLVYTLRPGEFQPENALVMVSWAHDMFLSGSDISMILKDFLIGLKH